MFAKLNTILHNNLFRFSQIRSISLLKSTECYNVVNSAKKPILPFPVLITNEHGSVRLPEGYNWPKNDEWIVGTHWSVDLGSADFSKELSEHLGSPALLSSISRLIIDVNRPLDSPTLFRDVGDGKEILLNKDLSTQEKNKRIERFYKPYHQELEYLKGILKPQITLSIHSFTPLYEGQKRDVEIGVLFKKHKEPAESLCKYLGKLGYRAKLNEPWSGLEGFMFAANLIESAYNKGIMLEFRQDLVVNREWRLKLINSLTEFLVSDAFVKSLKK